MRQRETAREEGYVQITAGDVVLHGNLLVPEGAGGLVVFAHGSGSSRHSPRNRYVAEALRRGGLGTLLFDLLTLDEEAEDLISGSRRFDIALLARRLSGATDWLQSREGVRSLSLGYFGASTGAAAALVASARSCHAAGDQTSPCRPSTGSRPLPCSSWAATTIPSSK
jgi:putative phosphoribosyl transferase